MVKLTSAALVLSTFPVLLHASQNFAGSFSYPPQPFTLNVDRDFIETTRLKASLTRFTEDLLDVVAWEDGTPTHNISVLRDYWVNEYDWDKAEAEINRKYQQFTTVVHSGENYTHPIPLHFVHNKSPREDAIPLLFLHGWPGSFLEVGKIIDELTNPPNSSVPAFHVVAPSLPGFGFSPAPRYPGLGTREAGQGFNDLMQQLGYKKYVMQAGDIGGMIQRRMAADFPDNAVAILSNLFRIATSPTDQERYDNGTATAGERLAIDLANVYAVNNSGYAAIQETKPLQLAHALTDSPLGFAAWISQILETFSQHYPWTPEEVITWSMMYIIQGPYGGLRIYKESVRNGDWSIEYPYVHQPLGVSRFPAEGMFYPADWIKRDGNLVYLHNNTRGGHFAAYEVPDLLVHDIREFLGRFGNETST